MPSSPSVTGFKALRALTSASAMALCVVACATYEEAPGQLGLDGSYGEGTSGSDSGGSSSSASVGGTGATATATAGMPSVPAGGTTSTAGTSANAGGGGQTASAGSAGSNGSAAGGGAAGGSGGTSASAAGGGAGGTSPAPTDDCPNDPAKTAPGVCGCGVADADTATAAGCVGIKAALVHRYDFEGAGTVVTDRVGTAHGSVKGGATLSQVGGKGAVVLGGGATGSYVDLPNKLISSLTSATLEAWVTWGGGGAWQRLFDFGDSTNATPEDNPANGKSYLFLTPSTAADATGVMRAVYSLDGGAAAVETRLDATVALPQVLSQVVLVVDDAANKLRLFVDGAAAGEQAFAGSLASINDVNAWLGRSQYNVDPEMTGTFHDFRVYKAALTPLQIATSFAGGPDPAFLSK